MGITFAVGNRALPRLSTVRRCTMIALLATLVAIVVEELFNPSLRRPGLPAVFFTTIGLVWALAATGEHTWVESLRDSLRTRWIVFPVATILAIAAGFRATWDFDAARAMIRTIERLNAEKWDRTTEENANDSFAGQLSPYRRLVAMQQLGATYLALARGHAEQYFRLMQESEDKPRDQRRAALAAEERQLAEEQLNKGIAVNSELMQTAQLFVGSGAVRGGLFQLKAQLADADGKPDEATRYLTHAAESLAREMRRRPYEPTLCFEYAQLTFELNGPDRLDDVIMALARPLRFRGTDQQTGSYLLDLSQAAPGFDEHFDKQVQAARQACAQADGVSAARPTLDNPALFAPEILRLASIEPFERRDYAACSDLLEHAVHCYEGLRPRPAMAQAATMGDWAETVFLTSPGEVPRAIALAEDSVRAAPDSADGRLMLRQIQDRIVKYQLFQGDEAGARERLQRYVVPTRNRAAQDELIGQRYAMLCRQLTQEGDAYSPQHISWIERSKTLSPQFPLTWLLAADAAQKSGNCPDTAEFLKRAAQAGATPETVASFCIIALTKLPDCEPLQEIQKQLAPIIAAMQAATQPATQPAPPAASRPASESMPAPGEPASQPAEGAP